jgi:hypothetical protein
LPVSHTPRIASDSIWPKEKDVKRVKIRPKSENLFLIMVMLNCLKVILSFKYNQKRLQFSNPFSGGRRAHHLVKPPASAKSNKKNQPPEGSSS